MHRSLYKLLITLSFLFLIAVVGQWFFVFFFPSQHPREVTPRGALTDNERQTIALFKQAKNSVVYIFVQQAQHTLFGKLSSNRGSGSGFIWDTLGHIVTNYHVVKGADSIAINLDNNKVVSAKLIGFSPQYDIAVLRLKHLVENIKPIPIGRSHDLQVGQSVLAIGNPYGLNRTLTTGIISALNRRLPTNNGREIAGVIQTDAAINPGNSGGPLIDSAGRLIGMNTAIISKSGASAGIGFAVPVDTINRIVPKLIRHERVPTPGIGISAADESLAARLGIQGIVVDTVIPGSSAERAGIKGIDYYHYILGDVITHIEGQRIDTLSELSAELAKIGIDKKVRLTIIRNKRIIVISITTIDIS